MEKEIIFINETLQHYKDSNPPKLIFKITVFSIKIPSVFYGIWKADLNVTSKASLKTTLEGEGGGLIYRISFKNKAIKNKNKAIIIKTLCINADTHMNMDIS